MISDNVQSSSWFKYLLAALLFLLAFHSFFEGGARGPLLLDLFISLVIIASVFAVSQDVATRLILIILAAARDAMAKCCMDRA